jgi:hypothetical protein
MKPASKSANEDKKNTATIEAKPKIKNWKGDVTRFMPTALKVKRDVKDAKGRIIKPSGKDLFTMGWLQTKQCIIILLLHLHIIYMYHM